MLRAAFTGNEQPEWWNRIIAVIGSSRVIGREDHYIFAVMRHPRLTWRFFDSDGMRNLETEKP